MIKVPRHLKVTFVFYLITKLSGKNVNLLSLGKVIEKRVSVKCTGDTLEQCFVEYSQLFFFILMEHEGIL